MNLQTQTLHGGQPPVVGHPQIVDRNSGRTGLAGFLHRVLQHLPAHHHGGQNPLTDLRRFPDADELSLAHDTHPVGNGHHLVELVGDDDDGHAFLSHHLAEHGEQLVGLLRRKHRRRLVQNQDIRPPVEGFQNLHPLLQPHADVPHGIVRIDLQAVFRGQLPDCVPGGGAVAEQTPFLWLPPQYDVLRHGKAGHQHEVLVYHAHAQLHGIFGAEGSHLLPLDGHFPRRGGQNSIEDVHQRGFACAVFTHQRKDLTPADGQ